MGKIILALMLIFGNCISKEMKEIQDKKQCLPYVLLTAFQAYKVYQAIKSKQTDAIVFTSVDMIKFLYLDYECFTENEHFDHTKFSSEILKNEDGKKKQCYLQHTKLAMGYLVQGMLYFSQGDYTNFEQQFQLVVSTLKDSLESCK